MGCLWPDRQKPQSRTLEAPVDEMVSKANLGDSEPVKSMAALSGIDQWGENVPADARQTGYAPLPLPQRTLSASPLLYLFAQGNLREGTEANVHDPDDDSKFHYQRRRRNLGVKCSSDTSTLLRELSNLDECALRTDQIESYLSQLDEALKTVRFLHSKDFERPDGYPIYMCSKNAYHCTLSLLAVENQLSGWDKTRLLEFLHVFLCMTADYRARGYSLPEDNYCQNADETELELEDQLDGQRSSEECSESAYCVKDDDAEDMSASDVLEEDIHSGSPLVLAW